MVVKEKGKAGWRKPVEWGQLSVGVFAWSVREELLLLWLPLLTGP